MKECFWTTTWVLERRRVLYPTIVTLVLVVIMSVVMKAMGSRLLLLIPGFILLLTSVMFLRNYTRMNRTLVGYLEIPISSARKLITGILEQDGLENTINKHRDGTATIHITLPKISIEIGHGPANSTRVVMGPVLPEFKETASRIVEGLGNLRAPGRATEDNDNPPLETTSDCRVRVT